MRFHYLLNVCFRRKTILHLIFNPINGFVGMQSGKAEQPV